MLAGRAYRGGHGRWANLRVPDRHPRGHERRRDDRRLGAGCPTSVIEQHREPADPRGRRRESRGARRHVASRRAPSSGSESRHVLRRVALERRATRAEALDPVVAARGPDRTPARGRRAARRAAARDRGRGLGQDAGAHAAHRAPARHRRRAPVPDHGDHLHQQGGRRDAPARHRAGRAPRPSGCGCSTFHSACLRMLRAHAGVLGYQRGFTIYDDGDPRRAVERIMKELRTSTRSACRPRAVAAPISAAKNEMLVARALLDGYGDDPQRRRIAEIYARYEKRLRAANAMDFDDLLVNAVGAAASRPDVLRSYQQRFTHVLVDEYQDTNRAQNELVMHARGRAPQHLRGRATPTSRSTASAPPTCATSCEFERHFPDAHGHPARAELPLAPRRSSTRRTPSSRRTPSRAREEPLHRRATRASDPSLPGGRRARRGGVGRARDPPAGARARRRLERRWPSSTAPTPRAACSRRRCCARTIPYRVVGGHALLRPPGDQGRPRVPAARREPARRGRGAARRQRPKRGIGATSVPSSAPTPPSTGLLRRGGATRRGGRAERTRARQGAHKFCSMLDDAARAAQRRRARRASSTRSSSAPGYGAMPRAPRTPTRRSRGWRTSPNSPAPPTSTRRSMDSSSAWRSSPTPTSSTCGRARLAHDPARRQGARVRRRVRDGHGRGRLSAPPSLSRTHELEEERRLCYVGVTRACATSRVTHAWTRSLFGTDDPRHPLEVPLRAPRRAARRRLASHLADLPRGPGRPTEQRTARKDGRSVPAHPRRPGPRPRVPSSSGSRRATRWSTSVGGTGSSSPSKATAPRLEGA